MRFIYTLFTAVLITPFSSQAAEKPNILFVLFDDMGYGEPTSYRPASLFKTPNIDRMAKEGIRFTDALPKTRSGKIMRRILRNVARGEYSQMGDVSTLADPSVVDRLVEDHRAGV